MVGDGDRRTSTRYDLSGACGAVDVVPRRPHQLVHPPQPGPVLGHLGRTEGAGDDSSDAFDTLATVLEVLCRTAAPLLPLVTESVWRRPHGGADGPSVHLADWPAADDLPADPELVASPWTGSARCARPPTRSARPRACGPGCPSPRSPSPPPTPSRLAPFVELIADEVNVKDVRLDRPTWTWSPIASLTVVFKVAAPRSGSAHPAGGGRGQAG